MLPSAPISRNAATPDTPQPTAAFPAPATLSQTPEILLLPAGGITADDLRTQGRAATSDGGGYMTYQLPTAMSPIEAMHACGVDINDPTAIAAFEQLNNISRMMTYLPAGTVLKIRPLTMTDAVRAGQMDTLVDGNGTRVVVQCANPGERMATLFSQAQAYGSKLSWDEFLALNSQLLSPADQVLFLQGHALPNPAIATHGHAIMSMPEAWLGTSFVNAAAPDFAEKATAYFEVLFRQFGHDFTAEARDLVSSPQRIMTTLGKVSAAYMSGYILQSLGATGGAISRVARPATLLIGAGAIGMAGGATLGVYDAIRTAPTVALARERTAWLLGDHRELARAVVEGILLAAAGTAGAMRAMPAQTAPVAAATTLELSEVAPNVYAYVPPTLPAQTAPAMPPALIPAA